MYYSDNYNFISRNSNSGSSSSSCCSSSSSISSSCSRGEYLNTDNLTINHHNFIIYQLNIFKFYL